MDITKIARYAAEIFTGYKKELPEFVNNTYAEDQDEHANEFLRRYLVLDHEAVLCFLDEDKKELLQLMEVNPNDEKLKADFVDYLVKKAETGKQFATYLTRFVCEFLLVQSKVDISTNSDMRALKMNNQSLKTFEELGNKRGIASTMITLGNMYCRFHESYDAKILYELSLKTFEELGDKSGIALSLHAIGNAYYIQGNYVEAVEMYDQSLRINEELGNRNGIITTLHQLLYAHERLGYGKERGAEIVKMYTQPMKNFEELGDKSGIAIICYHLGYVQAGYMEDLEEAVKMYKKSLEIFEEIRDKKGTLLLLDLLREIYEAEGNYEELAELYLQSLKVFEEAGDKKGILLILDLLREIHETLGNYEELVKIYDQVIKVYEELGDKRGITNLLHSLGRIHQDHQNYEEAVKTYNQSLKVYEELEDKNGIMRTLDHLGNVHHQGNYEELVEIYNQLMKVYEEWGDKKGIANLLHSLGKFYQKLSKYEEAEKIYIQSLKIFEELGNESEIASELYDLGYVYQKQGNYEEAVKKYKQSLKIGGELGDKNKIANLLNALWVIHIQKGNYEEVVKMYAQLLKINQEIEDRNGVVKKLHELIYTHMTLGNYEDTVKMYTQFLKINEEMGYKNEITSIINALGRVHEDHHNYEKAVMIYNHLLKIYEECDDKKAISHELYDLGYFYQNLGKYEEALKMYTTSLKVYEFEERGDKDAITHELYDLGYFYQNLGKYEEALKIYTISLKIFEEMEDKGGIASIMIRLGDINQEQGNYEVAENYYSQFKTIRKELKNIQKELEDTKKELGDKYEIESPTIEALAAIYENHDEYEVVKIISHPLSAEPPEEEEELSIPPTRAALPTTTLPEEISGKPKTLVRYPNIDCLDVVNIDEKFPLLVQLLLKSPVPGAIGFNINDEGLPDQPPEISIDVRAKGFLIEGSSTKVLKLDRDNDSQVRFVLIPKELGEKQIKVDFWQSERYLGTELHNILVTKEMTGNEEVKQPESSGDLSIDTKKHCPPDLNIIVEMEDNNNKILTFRLHKENYYQWEKFGQISLSVPPEELIEKYYMELSEMAKNPGSGAQRRMAAIGNEFWETFIPKELQREYWKFKDHIKSIQITSEEPWIPWEMIKPCPGPEEENIGTEDEPFWCLKFELSRWLSGRGPEGELPSGFARPVAPSDSDLSSILDEVKFIEQLGNLNPDIIGLSTFSGKNQVLDALETGGFVILHFASHCGFDETNSNESAIFLDNFEPLRPSDIHAYFKQPKPLIFINACEGAQMGLSFTGLGGWARRFVDKRAGAFAGALWQVNDELALDFARSFYTAFLKDKQTIAQAFRMAREAVREAAPSNSTWLAYVLYADPKAHIRKSS